jgi:hypothetical protein
LYGNADDGGEDGGPYDSLQFFNSGSCRFGGTLVLNFVQPTRQAGTTFTPYALLPQRKREEKRREKRKEK